MSRGSAVAGLLVCLLVLTLVAVLTAPRRLHSAITKRAEAAGVTANISLHPLEFAATLHEVEVQRGGWSVRCVDGRATIAPDAVLARSRALRSVGFERCDVTHAPGSASSETESDSTGDSSLPLALLREVPSVGTLAIGEVVVTHREFSLRATDVAGVSGNGTLDLQANVVLDAEVEAQGRAQFDADENVVNARLDGTIKFRGATLTNPTFRLSADGALSATDVRMTHPLVTLSATAAHRASDGALHIDGGSAELGTLPSPRILRAMLGLPAPEFGETTQVPTESGPGRWLLQRVPAATLALDRFRRVLSRVPQTVRLSNFVVHGLPRCPVLEIADVSAAPGSVRGSVRCGATSVELDVSEAGARLELPGVALSELDPLIVGTADTTLVVDRAETGVVASLGLTLHGAGVEHPAVAVEAVQLDGGFEIEATLPSDITVSPVNVSLTGSLGSVPIDATLSADPDDATWVVRAEGGVSEPIACQAMWTAIPDALVPSLRDANVAFSGSAAPRLRLTYTIGDTDSFDMRQDGFMGDCVVDSIDDPYDPSVLLAADYTHLVTEHVSAPVAVGPGTRDYATLTELPSYIPALMQLSEEIAFFENPGFSMMLMRRAVRMNLRESRYVYGGSTLSQQLVKNLFFTRDKTLARKFEEAIVVWAMEQVVPKERILELYMNCVEFAPDVYGIVAASEHYFGKPAADLTPLEAAFLAALKPAPSLGEHHRRRGHSPDNGWWHERLLELLQRLVEYGPYIDQSEVDYYAPYIVGFPTSENYGHVEVPNRPRPKGAVFEPFPVARARITGVPPGVSSSGP